MPFSSVPAPTGPSTPAPPAALRYGAAVVATAAALAVSLALHAWVAPNVFLFFFTAIILSAWYGGRGPALLATALSLPLANYFLLAPRGGWALTPADGVRMTVFAGVALLIGAMHETLVRARDEARTLAREAEETAAQLQEQAAELETQAAELQQHAAEAQALAEELEEAQGRLRESMERQLSEAQALAHVGSWEWVPAEDRLWWSDEMYRVYGLAPGTEVSLEAFLARVHPGDRARVRATIEEAMESGDGFELEHRIVRPDGAARLLHARGRVERDAAGQVARLSGTGQDVTGARAAEEAARRLAAEQGARAEADLARRRLEGVLESIGDAFVALDRGLRYTYVNRRAEETLGKPREALLGRTLEEAFPGAVGGVGWREMRRALETGEARSFEYHTAVLDRTVAVRVYPTDEGISVFYEDVTDVRRAERAERLLAEAGRVLAAPFDAAETLAALPRLLVPALADFCATVVAGEGGEPVTVEVRHADPAKAEAVRALLDSYGGRPDAGSVALRVLRTGEPVLVERVEEAGPALADPERQRRVEGLGMRSLVAVPLRSEARVVGVLALATAESERRLGPPEAALAEELARRAGVAMENARLHGAERAARRAAEAAAERTARLQAVTAALSEASTPGEVAEVVIGEGLATLGARAGWLVEVTPDGEAFEVLRSRGYDPEVVARFRRVELDGDVPLAAAIRTGEPVFLESPAARQAVYPALARDFDPLGFGAWASVPLRVEGRVVGGIGLSFAEPRPFAPGERDFMLAIGRQAALALERARLFEAERRARAEAEAANRAKFEFLTTMSHELRTPLNAIAGYVELLELGIRGPITPAQREDLERIRRSQTHLLGLINDVLNFARIETGHVHFDVRDVPLDAVLAGLEDLIGPQVGAKGLTYAYRAHEAPLVVRADAEKVRQIILNLLSNAVKFTPSGGRITLEASDGDGAVRVHVRDTGMGIPADKLATVFEPFVQVATGYTRTSEGTGLGLSISRDLARAMGGELTAVSREGEGSVFTLTLPAGTGEPGDREQGTGDSGTGARAP